MAPPKHARQPVAIANPLTNGPKIPRPVLRWTVPGTGTRHASGARARNATTPAITIISTPAPWAIGPGRSEQVAARQHLTHAAHQGAASGIGNREAEDEQDSGAENATAPPGTRQPGSGRVSAYPGECWQVERRELEQARRNCRQRARRQRQEQPKAQAARLLNAHGVLDRSLPLKGCARSLAVLWQEQCEGVRRVECLGWQVAEDHDAGAVVDGVREHAHLRRDVQPVVDLQNG